MKNVFIDREKSLVEPRLLELINLVLGDWWIERDENSVDPKTILLPGEIVIEFNPYLLHQCFGMGRISIQELIQNCIIRN